MFWPFLPFRFLSTLSLRRATALRASRQQPAGISIHALLAESDRKGPRRCVLSSISIHALLAESDLTTTTTTCTAWKFLSTLSLRRATKVPNQCKIDQQNFYPRSPCGERLSKRFIELWKLRFLSTLSLRRATRAPPYNLMIHHISIHALLAESDVLREPTAARNNKFLSTLSLRRATD